MYKGDRVCLFSMTPCDEIQKGVECNHDIGGLDVILKTDDQPYIRIWSDGGYSEYPLKKIITTYTDTMYNMFLASMTIKEEKDND